MCPATEPGHDRRNRDMNRIGAAQVTIAAITTGPGLEFVRDRQDRDMGCAVQLMSRLR
jgi:hypothetical protein